MLYFHAVFLIVLDREDLQQFCGKQLISLEYQQYSLTEQYLMRIKFKIKIQCQGDSLC